MTESLVIWIAVAAARRIHYDSRLRMEDRGTPQRIRLKESSPWEQRLLWFGALCLLGGALFGMGMWHEYMTWLVQTALGVLLVGAGFSIHLLSSSTAHVEREKLSIFSTMADDPTIAHREVPRAEIRAIEVMRRTRDGWWASRPVWEVAALLGHNRRQPMVRWDDPEQALQAARSSARVLDVEYRDADVEERPPVSFPAAPHAMSFGEFARAVRDQISEPSHILSGIGFEAGEETLKLFLWKQQLPGLIAILGSLTVAATGVLVVCASCAFAHMDRFQDMRDASGGMFVLGLFGAFVMLRHARHLGQRNTLIVRPAEVAVQSFAPNGLPLVRTIPLDDVEYILVTQPPGLLVVGVDREVVVRGGVSFRAYQKVAEILQRIPGWPRHATVRA